MEMAEELQVDSSRIYKYILQIALDEKPIFDLYRKVCETHGKVDYVDFERKYYQLYDGNFDVLIERCQNAASLQSNVQNFSPDNSSSVTFSDLPMDVLEKVVRKLALVDRLVLQKVSRHLRQLVDSTEVFCEKIRFAFGDGSSTINSTIRLQLEDLRLRYRKTDEDQCLVSSFIDEKKLKEYKDDRDVQQVMISDASTFLKNPKLKIDRLIFRDDRIEPLAEIAELVKSLNFQLKVRSIDIFTAGQNFLPIIQSLEPETLEELSLDPFSSIESNHPNESFDKLDDFTETEQWKKAKKLRWEGVPKRFRMEKLMHFKKIVLYNFKFTKKNLKSVRDNLLKSTHLEYGYLLRGYKDAGEDYADSKGRIAEILEQNPAFDSEFWRFSIPNSHDYYQLEFSKDCYQGYDGFVALLIERKTIERDPCKINEYIRKAALDQEPIFKAYKKLFKFHGRFQGAMDYVDFERKYYEFYHGKLAEKSSVTFSDLPMVVLEIVVRELKPIDRLALRKLSRNIRALVDSTEVYCEWIFIDFKSASSKIKIDGLVLHYCKTDDDQCLVSSFIDEKKLKEYKDDRDVQQVMISDASTFLKNPKLKIDLLTINGDRIEPLAEIAVLLKSLNFQLKVRSIDIFTAGETCLPIIQSLEPETLEELELDPFYSTESNRPNESFDQLDDLTETEQWKKAKKLSWTGVPEGFRMEKLMHFKEIVLQHFKFTKVNLTRVRDNLLKSTHLEYGYLLKDFQDVEEYDADSKDEIAEILKQNPAFDSKTWRFSIPNSHDYFQLEFSEDYDEGYDRFRVTLRIERVSVKSNN